MDKSYTLWKNNFSPSKCRVTWNCVERRSIRVTDWTPFRSFKGCLYLRYLHTHGHIIYYWKALFISVTTKYIVESSNDVVHVQWSSIKVIINVFIFRIASFHNHQWLLCDCQCTQGIIVCYWKTYCILVKWVIPLDWFIHLFMWIESNKVTIDVWRYHLLYTVQSEQHFFVL